MEEYKILKLKTGDNIIAAVANTSTHNVVSLHHPMIFKTVIMMDENMNQAEVLLLKNWAEYNIEKDIEISSDIIAASWKPDVVMINCYEMEKIKQDMPELYKDLKKADQTEGLPTVNPLILPMSGMPPHMMPPKSLAPPAGMANFNLNLPIDIIKNMIDFLEEQGVNLVGPGIENSEFDGDDMLDEEDMMDDDEPLGDFGNEYDDWSPDPNDYLK
jgi:hypothetical protein